MLKGMPGQRRGLTPGFGEFEEFFGDDTGNGMITGVIDIGSTVAKR
jgi:hypothetical protein